MSNRAVALAATLQAEMPEMSIMTAKYDRAIDHVDTFDGPVLVIADGIARGISISVYGEASEDISGMAAEVFRVASRTNTPLPDPDLPAELTLSFRKMEPLIDERDLYIGECLHFGTIEHSRTMAA